MSSIVEEEFDLYLTKNTVIPLNPHDMKNLRLKAVANVQALEDTFFSYGLNEKQLVSEKKWQVPMPNTKNVLLVGAMDLMSVDDNVIYDLKMTKNVNFMDETQLLLYCMMGLFSGYKTVKAGFIVPLRKEKVVVKEFEQADFEALFRTLKEEVVVILDNLKTGKWDYTYEKNYCFRCQVNQFCECFKRETASADRPTVDHGGGRVIQL
jgi:CRISPR/Cas system-associated exonuclease Cas4 (RecB family)